VSLECFSRLVATKLSEVRTKYEGIRSDESYLRKVLGEGREYAMVKSSENFIG